MATARVCKFQKERKQISYDCGQTWDDTSDSRVIQGKEPVERNSSDCGFSGEIKRTITSGSVCNGYDKYEAVYDEVSYDQGETWNVVESSKRIGNLIERFSSDCCELRSVSGVICTDTFEKANANIEEASLDGEVWVQTGRYTVISIIEGGVIECMDANNIRYLGKPFVSSGNSTYYYNLWTNDNKGYKIIGCEEDDDSWSFDNSIENIYVGSCAVNPYLSSTKAKKIYFSSGASGDFCKLYNSSPSNFKNSDVEELIGLENSKINRIGFRAFNGSKLKTLHLPSSCYYIDGHAFEGCNYLTDVIIETSALGGPYSPNYNWYYGQFSSCPNLSSVTFTSLSNGSIPENCFTSCVSLTDVTLGNPTGIGSYSFQGCSSLVTIDLGSNVTYIGTNAFYGCTSLRDVYIWQKANILNRVVNNSFPKTTRIHVPCEAWGYWYEAYHINHPERGNEIIPIGEDCLTYEWRAADINSEYECVGYDKHYRDYKYASNDSGTTWYKLDITRVGSLYEANSIDCGYIPQTYKALITTKDQNQIVIPCQSSSALTGSEVTSGTPYSSITSVIIGDCTISIATYCFATYSSTGSNITSVVISDSVTTIGENAFGYCAKLKSITIPDSVETIGRTAFSNCRSLSSCTIGSGVTSIGNSAFNWCSGLTSIDIPDSVTSIGSRCFESCINLTSVTLGSGVEAIGMGAFGNCQSLSSVTIPSKVDAIGSGAFYGCDSLTSVRVEATTPPTVSDMTLGNLFDYCDNLTAIYVPCESVNTYKATSGWNTYANIIKCGEEYRWYPSGTTCIYHDKWEQSIKQVSYNSGITWSNVVPTEYSATTLIEANSEDCGYMPYETKMQINYNNGTTYSAACDSSSAVTTADTNPSGYIYSGITDVIIGDCVTSINNSTFQDCSGLTSVTIPSSVTSIGSYGFGYCVSLTNITIPASVTEISPFAFTNCTSLVSVTLLATTPPNIYGDVFRNTTCKFYVPSGSVSAYKNASYWSSYSSRIYAIT